MAHTKRTRTSPAAPARRASSMSSTVTASAATPARQAAKDHTAGSRVGTLALFATLALSLGTAIAAAAWLIATHEVAGMTATTKAAAYSTNAKAPEPAAPAALTAPAANATMAASSPAAHRTTQLTAQQPAAPSAPSAPSAAGQRAFIDPVTGELRQPEHEELAAIAAAAAVAAPARRAAARTSDAAAEFFGPDGSIAAVVPEDLHTFTVATRGPDGRIVIEHAQGAASADRLVKANSAKKSPQAAVSRAQQKEDRNDR
jgi:hypothetical protein